jgi:putative flippase GtrA
MRKLLRYGTVSVVSTVTSMTVLGLLVATRALTPGWANLVATAVGTVPSFELNRRWVWGRTGRRSLSGEVGPFAALAVSVAGHLAAGLDTAPRTIAVEAASVAAFGSLWLLQFVVLDRLLFATRRAEPAIIAG